MNINIKRVYEEVSHADGSRLLVDRLWPRGISKEHAHITAWLKDVAPSTELRTWFHKDIDNHWEEFKKRYHAELKQNIEEIKNVFVPYKGTITLITSAKDVEHSHVTVLKSFLEKMHR